MTRKLHSAESVIALAERLNALPEINRFDDDDEREADRIAHSLADIESSMQTIMQTYLPQLLDQASPNEINDVLLDIGDELKHVLYHIRDPKYFRSLLTE